MQPCWPARPRVRTPTLRRLIGSSVVVAPPRGPSRMAVSRRSGKRPPRWAARLQARVGSGSASPPLGRADVSGQRTVSCASLAWRAVCLLADAPMLPGWNAAGRGHSAQLGRDLGRCCTVPGSATPAKVQYVPAARAGGSAWPPTGCAAPTLPCQVADSRTQDCEAAHHVSWRRARLGSGAISLPVGSAPAMARYCSSVSRPSMDWKVAAICG